MGVKKILAMIGAVAVGMVLAGPAAEAATPAAGDIVTLPVSFAVTNTNHTLVPCASDGKPYTIRGHITAPAAALANPTAATLYLHAVTQGEFYWQFNAVPGYNVAQQQAANGHVSVTIDRLGYGASDKPPGLGSCVGSQADTANQVITALRTGSYTTEGAASVRFPKVFLAGHSAGGLIATVVAWNFPKNIDGLINFGWADTTTSVFLVSQLANTTLRCALGGDAGAPRNYAKFGPDGDRILFYSATPEVRAAVGPLTNPDPCGDILSFNGAIAADVAGIAATTAPVLLVAGEKDALFSPTNLQLQKTRYLGNPDVQLTVLADTAHGFNYEASHLQSVALVDAWLKSHGG